MVAVAALADGKLSNISPISVEPFTKDPFHWFNITIIPSSITICYWFNLPFVWLVTKLWYRTTIQIGHRLKHWRNTLEVCSPTELSIFSNRLFLCNTDDQLFLTLYKEMYFRHIYASKPVRAPYSCSYFHLYPSAGWSFARRTTRILHELHWSIQFGSSKRSSVENWIARSMVVGYYWRIHLSVSIILQFPYEISQTIWWWYRTIETKYENLECSRCT